MDDRHEKLQELFLSAVRLERGARAAFFDQACGDDSELREQLESLLRASDETHGASDLLDDRRIDEERQRLDQMLGHGSSGDVGLTSASPQRLLAPMENVGRYRITRRIASGGMGTVYEAEQDAPRRRVALKMVHNERVSPLLMQRLEREVEILGRLQHPGIAQVYEAGTLVVGEQSQPFYAMEFIDGVSLTKYADQHDLDDAQRIDLLARICDAVHYAHQKGVIHRDLKPDNILVDAHGRPRILDFGVARTTSDATLHAATMTHAGQIIGTLAYMAPEQMDASAAVTTAADVYALGVVGFELLAGRLPHDVAGMSAPQAVKWLTEHDPPRLGAVCRRLAGDPDTILDKALSRDPGRRYESAAALATDLRLYLAQQPILARPPSALYQSRKFVGRHRALTVAVLSSMLILVAGIVGVSIAALQTNRALTNLEKIAAFQAEQLLEVDPEQMGVRLRQTLLAERRAVLEETGLSDEEIEATLADLNRALAGIRFTNVAGDALATNVLGPSLQSIGEQFKDQPLVRARLLLALGEIAEQLKRRVNDELQAEELFAESLRIRRDELGEDHLDTLRAKLAVGGQDLAQQAYEGFLDQLGPHHPETLEARYLAIAGSDRGAELESLLTDAERDLGNEHLLTLRVRGALGQYLVRKGDLDAGLELQRAAFEAAYQQSPTGKTTRDMLTRLGFNLNKYGRANEAEPLLRDMLDQCLERFGTNEGTISAAHRLGRCLEEQGKYAEAEDVLLRARAWYAPQFPAEHPVLLHNIAYVQYRLGKLEEAERNFRLVLGDRLENGTASTLRVANLAMVLADQGHLGEAERYLRRALARALASNGESWRPASIRGKLGHVLTRQGRLDEAEQELTLAHEGLTDFFGVEHRRTLDVAGYLAEFREAAREAKHVAGGPTDSDHARDPESGG